MLSPLTELAAPSCTPTYAGSDPRLRLTHIDAPMSFWENTLSGESPYCCIYKSNSPVCFAGLVETTKQLSEEKKQKNKAGVGTEMYGNAF